VSIKSGTTILTRTSMQSSADQLVMPVTLRQAELERCKWVRGTECIVMSQNLLVMDVGFCSF
jgi:hypothetical protein